MPRHYLYSHNDPVTREIVYIGVGSNGRAWHCTHSPVTVKGGYVGRSELHGSYLNSLQDAGYLPSDWVVIAARNLERTEALHREREWIDEVRPRFNVRQGYSLMKLTLAQLEWAAEERARGAYYITLAEELGVSTMTLHRALNGGSKRYEELLNAN